jgi:hypothetical protein
MNPLDEVRIFHRRKEAEKRSDSREIPHDPSCLLLFCEKFSEKFGEM